MTDIQAYDGTTPLQPALADLFGCSVKSQAKLTKLINQAKGDLGIANEYGSKGKIKSVTDPQQRLAIWTWHKDRLATDTQPLKVSSKIEKVDSDNVDIFQQDSIAKPYDGTTGLQPALAALCDCSIKSQGTLSKLIKQAKDGLGIVSVLDKTGRTSPRLSPQQRLAIWQWHYDRLKNVDTNLDTDNPAATNVDIFQQSELFEQSINEQVETIANNVEINPQTTTNQKNTAPNVDIIQQPTNDNVDIFQQIINEPIEYYDMNAMVKVAFYTNTYNVRTRQVIGLDGFYVNALMLAAGIDKKGVPKWIQNAVDDWSAFDDKLPITKQVKYLLIQELTKHIKPK